MTRKLFLTLGMAMLTMALNAQNSNEARIKQIREAYANRLSIMANQPYDEPERKVEQMTVKFNRMLPATGFYQETTTYYWTDDENETYLLKPTLYFVVKDYSRNEGTYKYYKEFLFDAETEEPMFFYERTRMGEGGKTVEVRVYFDRDGHIIKQLPAHLGPFADDVLEPDIVLTAKGGVDEKMLLKAFNSAKTLFHEAVWTEEWNNDGPDEVVDDNVVWPHLGGLYSFYSTEREGNVYINTEPGGHLTASFFGGDEYKGIYKEDTGLITVYDHDGKTVIFQGALYSGGNLLKGKLRGKEIKCPGLCGM